MKKIALIGTHGIGKTTLAYDLISKLKKSGKDADFLGEIVRKCPFEINEKTSKKAQIWIILNQIISEIENQEKCETLVCDRSVLDGYVYYVRRFGRLKAIEPLIIEHLKTYSSIIKIPIRKEFLKKDKIRSINPDFQIEIDTLMDKLLKRFNISYLNIKERLNNTEIIQEIIKNDRPI